MLTETYPPWPNYCEDEADAVRDVLLSNAVNYWTGDRCRQFEARFADFAGCQHAVAVANGSVALELALHALGIKAGDEVIVTPRTFFASASCIVNVGATPVFADVDPESQNITAATIRPCITPRTRAIICVHLAGWPCDMDPIMALAAEHHLFVIEDCAQAHGARYKGRPVGSIGHVGAWSFCQDKIMTTGGEGGMVTTNNKDLWMSMWSLKDHGKNWHSVYEYDHPPGFRWLHDRFGTNWRMTEMQAAIGLIQLDRMADWHAERLHNANTIWAAARRLPGLRVPLPPQEIEHAAYKCYLFVDPAALRPDWSRDRILIEIEGAGIPCFTGSCAEVYLEKAFDGTGWRPPQRLPNAAELGETSLMLLVHPGLSSHHLAHCTDTLSRVMHAASR